MTALLLAAVLALTPGPTAEIRGYITDQTAVEVVQALSENAPRPATIEISSMGGHIVATKAIIRAIRNYPGRVRCHTDVAASGAFWILQTCQERSVEPVVFLGDHFPVLLVNADTVGTTTWQYEADDLRKLADQLERDGDEMFTDIAARSGLLLEEVRGMIRSSPGHLWILNSVQAGMLNLTDRTETAAEFRGRE